MTILSFVRRCTTLKEATIGFLLVALLSSAVPVAHAESPSWWLTRGVINPQGQADDFAVLNQGQLKTLAAAAIEEMNVRLPDGAGFQLNAMLEAWRNQTSNADDFAAVNLGQLKQVAAPIYARLITAEIADRVPWANSPNPMDDYVTANIGQAKMVFNFAIMLVRLPEDWRGRAIAGDTDADGLPDDWETANGLYVGWDDSGFDDDYDGLTNKQEQLNNLDPNAYNEFGVRFYFRWRRGEAWAEGFSALTENPQDQPALLYSTKTISLVDNLTDTRTTTSETHSATYDYVTQTDESIAYQFTYTLEEAMKGTIWTSSTLEERDPDYQTTSSLTASITFDHSIDTTSDSHSHYDHGSYSTGEDHLYERNYHLYGAQQWDSSAEGPIAVGPNTFTYTRSGTENRYWHDTYWRTGSGAYSNVEEDSVEDVLTQQSLPGFSYDIDMSPVEYSPAAPDISTVTRDYLADDGSVVGSYSYSVELSGQILFDDVIAALEVDLDADTWSEWFYADTPDTLRMIDAYFTATNGGSSMYAMTWVTEYYVEFVSPTGGPLIGVDPASLTWMEVTTPLDGSAVNLESRSAVLEPGQRTQAFTLNPTSFVETEGASMNLAWLGTEGYASPLGRAPVQLSNPSPIVNIQQMDMSSVYQSDSEGLVARLKVKGTVTSELCDTLPGEDGVVRYAGVFMNHHTEPFAVIPLKVTKQPANEPDLEGSDLQPFPYLGEFDIELENVPVSEGVNNIRVVAVDPVYTDEGHSEWSTTITPLLPPPVGGGGEEPPPAPPVVASSLDFTLSSSELSSENPDSLTVTGKWRERTLQQLTLTETGPDTREFQTADGLLRLNLHVNESLSQEVADRFAVTVADDVSGPANIYFNVTETAPDASRFVAGEAASLLAGQQGGGEEGGGENEGQSEGDENVEPTPYGYAVSIAEVLSQSWGGTFLPLRIFGYGLPNDAEITIGSGANVISGVLKEVDPNTAGMTVLYRNEVDVPMTMTCRAPSFADIKEAVVSGLNGPDDLEKFARGYIAGFANGGYEMVADPVRSAKSVAQVVADGALATFWSAKIKIQSLSGEVSEWDTLMHQHFSEKATVPIQKFMNSFELASKALMKFLGEQVAVKSFLIEGILEGDNNKIDAALDEDAMLIESVLDFGAELLADSVTELKDMEDVYEKGKILGRITFEVMAVVIDLALLVVPGGQGAAAAKLSRLSKLTKFEVLTKVLENGKSILKTDKRLANVRTRGTAFVAKLGTTKMCFVAGTLVLTSSGLLPIEQVHAGSSVWARDEFTREEDWRPVVQTFVTHPTELCHVSVDVDGDGVAEETLSGTGEHPFWVEELGEFIPARALRVGWHLSLANAAAPPAQIVRLERERAPPGLPFTTYNFEVEGFHTYFVGEAGVWVHNWCEELFSFFHAANDKFKDMWKAFDWVIDNPGTFALLPSRWKLRMFNEVRRLHFADPPNLRKLARWNDPSKLSLQDLNKSHHPTTHLAKNMEKVYGVQKPTSEFTPHHIVMSVNTQTPLGDASRRARAVLADPRFNIDINDASNGMFLPNVKAVDPNVEWDIYGPQHRGSHPAEIYMEKVAERLEAVALDPNATAATVRDELQKIALDIVEKRLPIHNP